MSFDSSSEPSSNAPEPPPAGEPVPFLGIQFDCCRVYGRIYRDKTFRIYSGRCPRCMRRIEVPIGTGGVGARFFRAE